MINGPLRDGKAETQEREEPVSRSAAVPQPPIEQPLQLVEEPQGEALSAQWVARRLGGRVESLKTPGRIEAALGQIQKVLGSERVFRRAASEFALQPLVCDAGVDCTLLCEDEDAQLRLELVKLRRHARIPLHDHPGSRGGQVVLSGAVRLRQFDPDPVERSEGSRLAVLRLLSDRVLGEGGTGVYTETQGNVHDLEAMSPVCVLLNLVLAPFPVHTRSWYFPVSPLRQHGVRIVTTKVGGSGRHPAGRAVKGNPISSGRRGV